MYELFGDYLEADERASSGLCIALAISARPLGNTARNAINKSLAALGLGSDACTYATLTPANAAVEGGDVELDVHALFSLIEGLDPVRLIATDERVAEKLGKAYRASIACDTATRIFGRGAAVFENLEAMMETEAGKQKAWALFKTLK